MANKTTITAAPGGREITIGRIFDAPLEKIWRAYTTPELYIQWIGPKGYAGRIDAWELYPGGKYGYTHSDEQGNSFSFIGYRHEVKPESSIVETFEWLGMPGHISLNTATFESLEDNKTKVTATSVFQTPEDRDGMMQSGMERGVREGHERLDELLPKI